jgi:HlyD family secretion protein
VELQKGDTIAVFDTTTYYLQKIQLEMQKKAVESKFPSVSAQVEIQEVELNRLRKDEVRILSLLKDKAVTQKQVDDIQAGIAKIERSIDQVKTQNISLFAELDVMDANIARIDDNIKRAVVISPIDGVVLMNYIEENEFVVPGRSLLKMAELDEMILKAYVDGDQLSELKIGDSLRVRIDKPNNEWYYFNGILTWVSGEAEFTPSRIQTKKERIEMVYAIKVRVNNDGKIKIGMPGEVIW